VQPSVGEPGILNAHSEPEVRARSADEILEEQAKKTNPRIRPLSDTAKRQQVRELGSGKKPCNYIFTVGKAGSGKSTFQSHLLRYLLEHDEHHAEPDPEFTKDDSTYQKYRETVASWNRRWVNGAFPERTHAGKVVEVRLMVTPIKQEYKQRKLPAIPFGFLEISGEDFKTLVQAGEHLPELLPSLDAFLNSSRHTIAIIFVCQGDNMGDDDFLFSQFLEYLDRRVSPQFKDRCNAVLVLANPDKCAHRLADALEREYNFEKLDVEGFVRFFTPQTYRKLKQWGRRAAIAPFSVGDISEEEVEEGGRTEMIKRIIRPSFNDVGLIYDWLYRRFTKYKPRGKTLRQRAAKWLGGFAVPKPTTKP
jgi:hypothetical protein